MLHYYQLVPMEAASHGQLFHYKNVHYYLFAKSGFTKGCIDKAAEMGNVTLVEYEDMI